MDNNEIAKNLISIALKLMNNEEDSKGDYFRVLLDCAIEILKKRPNSAKKDLSIKVDLEDFINKIEENQIQDKTFKKDLYSFWGKLIRNNSLFDKVVDKKTGRNLNYD